MGMSLNSAAQLLLRTPLSLLRSTSSYQTRYLSSLSQSQTRISNPEINFGDGDKKEEDIVIVGAGIGGLATAVALQRLGIRSRVLEQADCLRTGGTALTLSNNGWKVLDAIGVGNHVRSHFLPIKGISIKSDDGRELLSFSMKKNSSQETRAVERKVVLESLANALPSDTISFSSGLSKIETNTKNNETLLQLEDGSLLSAKIVIGCDGVWSQVAKWMGFSEPKYAGHICYRGIGSYPKGHKFDHIVHYTYGRGVRAVFVPISNTKIYWSVIFNSSSPGPRVSDPVILRQQAHDLTRNWSEFQNIIDHTPDETLVRNPLMDRWLWPATSPPPSTGNVVLVGDAWHPMTPNLGQGACCALEDSIVLSKKLADAITKKNVSVEEAFREYGRERWRRVFGLTVKANLVGAFLQSENPLVCNFRNNVVVRKMMKPESLFQHTSFEFEPLGN